jgi:hypothetical protein
LGLHSAATLSSNTQGGNNNAIAFDDLYATKAGHESLTNRATFTDAKYGAMLMIK